MAKYSVLMQRTASATSAVGSITVAAAAPKRAKIYDIVIGSEAAPADNPYLWQVQRCTTSATGSAVTPQPIDPADAAALTVASSNVSTNGTLTAGAFMLTVPLNQRATFRWVAAPGGEIMLPATASNGVHFITPTMTALLVTATTHFEEQ